MTVIIDASALFAQANRRDPAYVPVAGFLRQEPGPFVTSEPVAAEADYLILKYPGISAELHFLEDLAEGTLDVDCLTQEELRLAHDIARRYRDLELGLADCSLIVLAYRHRTCRRAAPGRRLHPLTGRCLTAASRRASAPRSIRAPSLRQQLAGNYGLRC